MKRIYFFGVIIFALIGCKTTSLPPESSASDPSGKIEIFGVQFRDQLRTSSQTSRDDLQRISDGVTRALEQMKILYSAKTGDYQPTFEVIAETSEDLKTYSQALKQSVKNQESTSVRALAIWKSESAGLRTEDLKAQSEKAFAEAQNAYKEHIVELRQIEKKVAQTLPPFHNHVGFLKNKLNSKTIASLQGMAVRLQVQLENLSAAIQESLKKTDQYLARIQN